MCIIHELTHDFHGFNCNEAFDSQIGRVALYFTIRFSGM